MQNESTAMSVLPEIYHPIFMYMVEDTSMFIIQGWGLGH